MDQESAFRAEKVLRDSGAALVWVTHDDRQPSRVGGRVLNLPLGDEVTSQHDSAVCRVYLLRNDELYTGKKQTMPELFLSRSEAVPY